MRWCKAMLAFLCARLPQTSSCPRSCVQKLQIYAARFGIYPCCKTARNCQWPLSQSMDVAREPTHPVMYSVPSHLTHDTKHCPSPPSAAVEALAKLTRARLASSSDQAKVSSSSSGTPSVSGKRCKVGNRDRLVRNAVSSESERRAAFANAELPTTSALGSRW